MSYEQYYFSYTYIGRRGFPYAFPPFVPPCPPPPLTLVPDPVQKTAKCPAHGDNKCNAGQRTKVGHRGCTHCPTLPAPRGGLAHCVGWHSSGPMHGRPSPSTIGSQPKPLHPLRPPLPSTPTRPSPPRSPLQAPPLQPPSPPRCLLLLLLLALLLLLLLPPPLSLLGRQVRLHATQGVAGGWGFAVSGGGSPAGLGLSRGSRRRRTLLQNLMGAFYNFAP